MRARDPYQQALSALAGFAGAGRFGWGEPLVATALAGELGLSATPVREALARLAGEGLIEHRPGRGYYALSPTAAEITDLYDHHRRLVVWALEAGLKGGSLGDGTEALARVEALYDRMVATADSRVLTRAHRRVVLQLRPIRRIEDALGLLDLAAIAQQERLFIAGAIDELGRAASEYHEGRKAGAAMIVSVLRRSSERIDEI